MAITQPDEFPFKPQEDFVDLPIDILPGDAWLGDVVNERHTRGLIAAVTEVAQVNTITIDNFNATDAVGVTINGGLVQVVATTDADATALLLEAALEAAVFLSGVISDVSVASNVLTVTFELGQAPTITEYAPDTTTAAVAETQAAVLQQQLLFGYGVAKEAVGSSANFTKIRKPTALTDIFAGVLVRTYSTDLPPDLIENLGFNTEFLCPGYAYTLAQRDMGICVEYVGTAPTTLDDVYWIASGADAGKWRVDDGGTSQVSTLTVTSVADGNAAFSYDGLPSISTTASGTAATDAAALVAAFNANAQYAAIGSAVDNLDGTFTITFSDSVTHTFSDDSTGTSTIAENIDTAAVAATAVLIEGYSWGRPSVTVGDTPRAYLLLNRP